METDIGSADTRLAPLPPPSSEATLSPDFDEARVQNRVAATLFGETVQPVRVGRFTVLSELGRGGMGVVYSGYDEQLDRKVAIKLVRFDRGTERAHRERLLREAQAMAKLSHPNVVQVYEVGEHEGQLFIAMEFVAGGDLRRWLDEGPHAWRHVVAVFAGAGRGLAAAHGVGLVHRDFKPANVLIDAEGRARITDFGLTRLVDNELEVSAETPIETLRTGKLAGTPAYMAPEQWSCEPLDARTDQFAFCIALFEALYGTRPFAGSTLASLGAAVQAGKLVRVDERGVPDRVRRAVRRGLSIAPDDRYPSMDELLHALTHDPWRTSGRVGLIAASVVGVGIAAFALRNDEVRCEAPVEALEPVWSDARRAAVRQRFDASDRPYAEHAREAVIAAVDAWIDEWVGVRLDACRSTWVHRSQSEEALDLRMQCLDERLSSAASVIDRFVDADEAVVDAAVEAAQALPRLSICSNLDALRAAHPPPPEELAAEIEALRDRLRTATSYVMTGHVQHGRDDLLAVVATSENLDYPPLRARALMGLGILQNVNGEPYEAERTLREALPETVLARDPTAEVNTWHGLLEAVSLQNTEHARAVHWALAARAAAMRSSEPEYDAARIESALGRIYLRLHDFEAAHEATRRAMAWYEGKPKYRGEYANQVGIEAAIYGGEGDLEHALSEGERARDLLLSVYGPDHAHVLNAKFNLAHVLIRRGDFEGAAAMLADVDAGRQRVFGADSPANIPTLNLLGINELSRGNIETAVQISRRAVELAERHYPENDVRVGETVMALANAKRLSGEPEAALSHMQRAHRIFVAAHGSEHAHTLQAKTDVGLVLLDLGRSADARTELEQAVEISSRVSPDDADIDRVRLALAGSLLAEGDLAAAERHGRAAVEHLEAIRGANDPILPYGLSMLGDVLVATGRPDEAESFYRRALDLFVRGLGEDAAPVGLPLVGLGGLLVDVGRLAEAREHLERGTRLVATGAVGQVVICTGEHAMARLSWAEGKRAIAAQHARAALRCLPEDEPNRARLQRWAAGR